MTDGGGGGGKTLGPNHPFPFLLSLFSPLFFFLLNMKSYGWHLKVLGVGI
jgi:hypothetical protein